jgi:hypothetical protein
VAVRKFLSKKDSTIYSYNPTQNTGLDEILSLIISNGKLSYDVGISRALLEFDNSSILSTYNSISSSKDISLKLFVANAIELPSEYTINVFNINDSWKNGYGRTNQVPITDDGVSWKSLNNISDWTIRTGSYSNYSPNSYSSSYWRNDVTQSVTFGIYDEKNINTSVKNLFLQQVSQSLNGGFLVKFATSHEQDVTINSELNFYSKDTHTIYQPQLELKWDDSIYSTTGSLITMSNFQTSFANNPYEFSSQNIQRLNILSREKFPQRTFSTGSLYTNQKYLPPTTYYSIVDLKTGQPVIEFDENYTKVSRDSNGNYFNLYLQNFEQNRYYSIELKIVHENQTYIHKDSFIFKVLK